jgi:hypothetical protein
MMIKGLLRINGAVYVAFERNPSSPPYLSAGPMGSI